MALQQSSIGSKTIKSSASKKSSGKMVVTEPWPMSHPLRFQNGSRAENIYVSLHQPSLVTKNVSRHNPIEGRTRCHSSRSSSSSYVILPPAKGHKPIHSSSKESSRSQPQGKTSVPLRGMMLGTERVTPTPTCVPWLKKIKVVKKIQKKIGIGGKPDGVSSNSHPPLRFNSVHGDNILLAQSGSVARRAHSFCKAIAFSDRPVKVNESVCLKFIEVSSSWSGVLRFGFTTQDPNSIKSALPKYACPDLTSRPGFWAKAFHDYLVKKDSILFYYVNHAGDVHFGINGEELGIFFKDVDTRGPLWALFDIYGNTTGIELVDPKSHLNNSRRSLSDPDEVSSLGLSFQSQLSLKSDVEINPIRHYPETVFYNLQFHQTHGQHVELGKYRYIARKYPNEYFNGYVFTSRPVQVGETLILQVQETEPLYAGSMAFGLTSCHPETINPNSLPDDSYFLQDRSEYWVVKKDAANNPSPGDELAFTISASGAVHMSKNGGPNSVLMYVDTTVALYAFFDLYGTTQKVALVGSIPISSGQSGLSLDECCNGLHSNQLPQDLASLSQMNDWNVRTSPTTPTLSSSNVPVVASTSRNQLKASAPSCSSYPSKVQQEIQQFHLPSSEKQQSFGESSHAAQISGTIKNQKLQVSTDQVKGGSSKYPTLGEVSNWTVECVACCEKPVDSVFYQCGHLSMCYECAYEYWKTRQKKYCPICRQKITDVIRIYKS